MQSILFLLLFTTCVVLAKGQQLSAADISTLVDMVDGEIDLTKEQEKKLQEILQASYDQLTEIQKSNKTEVEKLYMIRSNQEEADAKLQVVFTLEQYQAYKLFVNGDNEDPTTNKTFSDRVENISAELHLKGDMRKKFTRILTELEVSTIDLLRNGYTEAIGLDLLVEILSKDMELIHLLGKPTYELFFDLRANGALSDAEQGETDIEMVLMFYDITDALTLSSPQTMETIRMILTNEIEKEKIRNEYKHSPALMKEKTRHQEEDALMKLQSILTVEQIDIFLNLIGK